MFIIWTYCVLYEVWLEAEKAADNPNIIPVYKIIVMIKCKSVDKMQESPYIVGHVKSEKS